MVNINTQEELSAYDKQLDEIVKTIINKANIIIGNELPRQDCSSKELLAKALRDKIKKKVANVLYPGSMGLTVNIGI